MIESIIFILLILWLLGFLVLDVGGFIHILLVLVLIVIVYRLISGQPMIK